MATTKQDTTDDITKRRTILLCRAKAGERNAFDLLQEELLLLGGYEAEEDVLREAFLALYLNLHRIDREMALLPFLYRVARNKSYDILRERGRFDAVSLDDSSSENLKLLETARRFPLLCLPLPNCKPT
jgi:DNA-directed RNA polymerase specialized sigma24 family protein